MIFETPTYHVRRFLTYNFQFLGSFWTSLRTLKSNVINGSSLKHEFCKILRKDEPLTSLTLISSLWGTCSSVQLVRGSSVRIDFLQNPYFSRFAALQQCQNAKMNLKKYWEINSNIWPMLGKISIFYFSIFFLFSPLINNKFIHDTSCKGQ